MTTTATRNILIVLAVAILVALAVKMWDRNESPSNELDRDIEQIGADLEEGAKDIKRDVQDAVD